MQARGDTAPTALLNGLTARWARQGREPNPQFLPSSWLMGTSAEIIAESDRQGLPVSDYFDCPCTITPLKLSMGEVADTLERRGLVLAARRFFPHLYHKRGKRRAR